MKINYLAEIKIPHLFSDIKTEILACRQNAALFDFSFVFTVSITGYESLNVMSKLVKRDLKTMKCGEIKYALSHDEKGFIRSDLTVWKKEKNNYILMSGLRSDLNVLLESIGSNLDCKINNISSNIRVFSIQGPNSFYVLSAFTNGKSLKKLEYFRFAELKVLNIPCLIGRLGYTGELGYEIVVPVEHHLTLWKRLSSEITPCGLIALNQLRIEAGFIFFGNELRLPVTATELGLQKFSKYSKERQKFRLISFQSSTNQNLDLWSPTKKLEAPDPSTIVITSACSQLNSSKCLGLGFVETSEEAPKRHEYRDLNEKFWEIKEVPLPFYDTVKQRPRVKFS